MLTPICSLFLAFTISLPFAVTQPAEAQKSVPSEAGRRITPKPFITDSSYDRFTGATRVVLYSRDLPTTLPGLRLTLGATCEADGRCRFDAIHIQYTSMLQSRESRALYHEITTTSCPDFLFHSADGDAREMSCFVPANRGHQGQATYAHAVDFSFPPRVDSLLQRATSVEMRITTGAGPIEFAIERETAALLAPFWAEIRRRSRGAP